MFITKNLQYLRKRDKITQEDLAEKLNVSRQSVSKWETGEAYPETEKLLAICDLFDVSLDSLMRTDMTEGIGADNQNDCISENVTNNKATEVEVTDFSTYAQHINKFSRAIAIGVMLILLGVAICIALSGYSFTLSGAAAELTGIMAGVAVILFVAGAVFLFIFNGQKNEAFRRKHPVIAEPDDTTHKGFGAIIAGLASGILIDVVFLIVMTALIATNIIKTGNADMATCYVVSAFMAALAVIVGGMVYMGIQHDKYDVKKYNDQTSRDLHPTEKDKVAGALSGVVMLSATAIFLLIGFVWNNWHPGWVVFPIGGIICGIINVIFNAKK